jgi:hypothetical protein
MYEKRFIYQCIKAYLGDRDPQGLRHLYQRCRIRKLQHIITGQNIGGFFFHLYKLGIFEGMDIPEDILEDWKMIAGRNSIINSINDREALWFTDRLNREGIDYIYLKGLATRKRCYDNDHIKYSEDIDVFIKRADYERVKSILIENGYAIPRDHYIDNIGIAIPFEEFEKGEHEISFVRSRGKIKTTIDLQWDYVDADRMSIFHSLYDINSLYDFEETDTIEIDGLSMKVFHTGTDLLNMAFHYGFHHGFRGLQWLIDICSFVNNNIGGISIEDRFADTGKDLRKVLGIVLLMAYGLNGISMNDGLKRFLGVDRLLPFEYRYYRSMAFKPVAGISNSISLLVTKVLLPSSIRDRLRALRYMLFDPGSIKHRLDAGSNVKGITLPFYLLKLLIYDIWRKVLKKG